MGLTSHTVLHKLRNGCLQVWTGDTEGLGPSKWWEKMTYWAPMALPHQSYFSYLAGEIGPLSSPGHESILGEEKRKGSVCVRACARVIRESWLSESGNKDP